MREGVRMGSRGYLIVKLRRHAEGDRLWEIKKHYESLDGVEFVDRVIGAYDFLLTLDLPFSKKQLTIERVLATIKKDENCAEIISLKSDSTFGRHEEVKDLKILKELH
jgi:hypothetical protein